MDTIINSIELYINNKKQVPEITELDNEKKSFKVTKRFKLSINIPDECNNKISCKFNIKKPFDKIIEETGEDLFSIGYYWENYKLNIGTTGDIPELVYKHSNDSIEIIGSYPYESISFFVAYVDQINETSELSAWMASDPSV